MLILFLCRLTLNEIAAAAELILAQEDASSDESCDEGADSECEGVGSDDLGDSGYGGEHSPMDTRSVLLSSDYKVSSPEQWTGTNRMWQAP